MTIRLPLLGTLLCLSTLASDAALAAPDSPPPAPPQAEEKPAELAQVIVTARKRDERLVDVPVAVTSFGPKALDDYNIRSFADYATKVPNLSFAYGNGSSTGETGTGFANARTIAIRGVAGARTTAYYLDDTPLPGAIDVRVLDLQGIEILKGPQGTLFGESSLGGTVRLISRKPSTAKNEFQYMVEGGTTQGGGASLNGGLSAVANFVLQPNQSAIRLVGFADSDAGYLTRTYRKELTNPASPMVSVDNQGARRSAGGSVSALMRLGADSDMTLRFLFQRVHYNGFPASYAPLPAFEPLDVIAHTANIQPESRDQWTLPTLIFRHQGKGWSLHSSSSYFQRKALDTEDSTEGTAQFLASYGLGTPPVQAFAWTAHRNSQQFSHETRLSFNPSGAFSATAGVFYSSFKSQRDSTPIYGTDILGLPGSSLMWTYNNDYNRRDLSLFGEIYYTFLDTLTLTLGTRFYWLRQDDHTRFDGVLYGVNLKSDTDNRASGNNPKIALSYKPNTNVLAYASASKGFRAGGSQTDLTPLLGGCVTPEEAARLARIAADTVWSYELGAKLDLPEPGLVATAAVYHVNWKNIQQPAFIPACAFYLQGNAGAAVVNGAELELSGRVNPALSIRAGLGYQHARITEMGSSKQAVGSRIKQVPTWTATLGAFYERALSDTLKGFASADYSYTGDSISSNSTALPLHRGSYSLVNARVGVMWAKSQLSLDVTNLTNARPNLGDVGYLGYQRFEADGVTPIPQVVTMPPRRIMIQYRRRF